MMLIMSNFFDEENGHHHHQSSLGSNNPTTAHGTTTDTQIISSVVRNRYNESQNVEDHRVVMKLIDLGRDETDHKVILSPKPPPPPEAASPPFSSQLSSRRSTAHSSFLKSLETNKFHVTTGSTATAGKTVSLSSVRPLLSSVANSAPAVGSAATVLASIKSSQLAHSKLPFPWKLQQLLDDVDQSVQQQQSLLSLVGSVAPSNKWDDIVSWMPDGKAFRVHQPDVFAETIMRRYFKMSKYTSFTRQVCPPSHCVCVNATLSLFHNPAN